MKKGTFQTYILLSLIFSFFFVSCFFGGGTEPQHNHTYTAITEEGFLSCPCGQSLIADPYIAFLNGDTVTSFHYLSKGSSSSFGIEKSDGVYTYSNSTNNARNVVIRTKTGQNLVVDAPLDSVRHYGTAYKDTIKRVAPDSFYVQCKIDGCVEVNQGHICFDSEKEIPLVIVESREKNPVRLSLDSDSQIKEVQIEKNEDADITIDSSVGEETSSNTKIKKITTQAPVSVAIEDEVLS